MPQQHIKTSRPTTEGEKVVRLFSLRRRPGWGGSGGKGNRTRLTFSTSIYRHSGMCIQIFSTKQHNHSKKHGPGSWHGSFIAPKSEVRKIKNFMIFKKHVFCTCHCLFCLLACFFGLRVRIAGLFLGLFFLACRRPTLPELFGRKSRPKMDQNRDQKWDQNPTKNCTKIRPKIGAKSDPKMARNPIQKWSGIRFRFWCRFPTSFWQKTASKKFWNPPPDFLEFLIFNWNY